MAAHINRELKQTDAAAERRRSTSKFLFRKTRGQVIHSALDMIHPLTEWRFECDHLLSAAASVCLSSLLITIAKTEANLTFL